jgi:hypothetical protein
MQNKSPAKNLNCVMFFLVWVLLSACQPKTVEKVEIVNDHSRLLNLLIRKSDFSGDWQWTRSILAQKPLSPTNDNHQLDENAIIGLTGYYGTENYYITIWHNVDHYSQPVSWFESINVEFDNAVGETFTPTFIEIGDSTHFKCIREPEESNLPTSAVCKIITGYTNIVSTLTFYGPSRLTDDTILEIINPILGKIDERVKNIDIKNK